MKRSLFAGAALLAVVMLPAGAIAQIKIGVINSYSGQFADTGAQIDNGIKLYMNNMATPSPARRSRLSARIPVARTRTLPSVSHRN